MKIEDFPLSSAELADAVGLSRSYVRSFLSHDLIRAGEGKKIGRDLRFRASALDWVKTRKDGRKKTT